MSIEAAGRVHGRLDLPTSNANAGVRAVELNVAARLRTWRCCALVGAIGTFEDLISTPWPT